MIIITFNPDWDYHADDESPPVAYVIYGTNNPIVAFRLLLSQLYKGIDILTDDELLNYQRGSLPQETEFWSFSRIPVCGEGELRIEEVSEIEVFLGVSIEDILSSSKGAT